MKRKFVILLSAAYFACIQPGLCAPPGQKAATGTENEACAQLLPADLRAEITKDFPGFRPLRIDDYDPQDIAEEKQYYNGSECISAASGDYFGDKSLAYGFLLFTSSNDVLVVVAHELANHGWKMTKLTTFNISDDINRGGKFNYYLNNLEPGTYSTVTDDGDMQEPGRVEKITSKYPGVVYGAIESTGIAYFFVDGRWVHTYISD